MRGLALMGCCGPCRSSPSGPPARGRRATSRVRDPRRRDARVRGRRVPARSDPGPAQRRPRAAAARRPLPRRLEHLVADRLDRRPGGRRLPPPAPAASALADRRRGQPRLRGGGPRRSSGGCPTGAPDSAGEARSVANSGERVAFPGHASDRRPPQYRCPACRASVRAALRRVLRSSRRGPGPLSSAPAGSPGSTSSRPTAGRRSFSRAASAGTRSTSRTSSRGASGRRSTSTPATRTATAATSSRVLHFPVYDKPRSAGSTPASSTSSSGPTTSSRCRAVELRPVSLLFRRADESEEFREQLLSRGSGRLLYEVLDDLYDYCFPILDKIGFKLEQIDEEIGADRGREGARHRHPQGQAGDHLLPQDHQAAAADAPPARALDRALPAGGARALLRRHRRRERAHLGPARQLQGGRRGARGHERVAHLAPAERHPLRPHDLQRRAAAADVPHRLLRDERPLPRLQLAGTRSWAALGLMVVTVVGMLALLPLEALALSFSGAPVRRARRPRPIRGLGVRLWRGGRLGRRRRKARAPSQAREPVPRPRSWTSRRIRRRTGASASWSCARCYKAAADGR